MLDRLKHWATILKRDVLALYLAMRDPRVPWYVKALAAIVAGYGLSPIDLIPDFIPVIGYLDDLLLLPLGIWLVIRLIPDEVMADLRKQAARRLTEKRPRSNVAAFVIIVIWLVLAGLLIQKVFLMLDTA